MRGRPESPVDRTTDPSPLGDLLPGRPPELTALEFAFLTASVRADSHERWTAARSSRRLRLLCAVLAFFVVAVAVGGRAVWDQRQDSVVEQKVLHSGELADRSEALLGSDPGAAGLLAGAAYRIRSTAQAVAGLDDAPASAFRGERTWPQTDRPTVRSVCGTPAVGPGSRYRHRKESGPSRSARTAEH